MYQTEPTDYYTYFHNLSYIYILKNKVFFWLFLIIKHEVLNYIIKNLQVYWFGFVCIPDYFMLFQVTAMKEIANIADIVSTEGLDSYNRELLDEVRNIVHKCLTEQFEDLPKDKMRKKGSRKRRQKDHLITEYE